MIVHAIEHVKTKNRGCDWKEIGPTVKKRMCTFIYVFYDKLNVIKQTTEKIFYVSSAKNIHAIVLVTFLLPWQNTQFIDP